MLVHEVLVTTVMWVYQGIIIDVLTGQGLDVGAWGH